MSVHEETMPGGATSYVVRWRQGGRNRSKRFNPAKLGGKVAARTAARTFDGQMARAQALGDVGQLDRGKVTFGEYVDQLLERSWWLGLSAATQDLYALQLDNRLLPYFGDWALRDIFPASVEDFVVAMRRKKDKHGRVAKDPTILKVLGLMQAILKRAVVDGEITVNPVAQIDKPRQQRTREPKAIAPIYVERMRRHLQAAGQAGDAMLVCLLAYAGPRPESEAVTLPAAAIRKRTMLIRASKQYGKPRTLPIEPPLAKDLAAWSIGLKPAAHGLLVPFAPGGHVGLAGEPWSGDDWDNWRERAFRPAARAAGIDWDVRPRDLRGSYATLLIHEGLPITVVAERLGDSPQTVLKHYADVFDEFDPAEALPAAEAIQRARIAAVFPPGSQEEKAALAATG